MHLYMKGASIGYLYEDGHPLDVCMEVGIQYISIRRWASTRSLFKGRHPLDLYMNMGINRHFV